MIAEHASPAKPRSLFEIGDDLLDLERLIESLDGDISDPAVEERVMGWLNGLGAEQATKLDGYVNLIRKWEGEMAAARAEIDRYQKSANVRMARIERFEARLKLHMEKTGQKKIETASGRVLAIHANGGKLPLIIDEGTDPTELPEDFQEWTVRVDAAAVRAAVEAGKELSFARLGERSTHLRIK